MARKRRELAAVRIFGARDLRNESLVHSEPVPGQMVRILCGFEGGAGSEITDDPIECSDCLAILNYFRAKVPNATP